ncbi:MAG: LCP family protein [Clostridia bacterium]|nr:LCP family protein [Clostridia bacterium]
MINIPTVNGESGGTSNFLGPILDPFKFNKGPVNILVLGGDKVNKNSDTMILVNYDPASAKVSMLSIPRDTYVHVKGSTLPKINSAYPAGGADRAVEAVSNLLGVNITYFVYVDTSSVAKIIDLLDGVDFYVPADMDYDDPIQKLHIHLKKGQHHLSGAEVVQFMRFRQPNHYTKQIKEFYDGSDLKRIDAQQKMIKAILEQKSNFLYITKVNDVINTIFENIETNLTVSDTLKLTQNISLLAPSQVQFFKLEGESEMKHGGWYYFHDEEKAQEIVRQYFQTSEGFSGTVNPESSKDNDEDDTPVKSTPPKKKKSYTKNNPSNHETSIKGTKTPKP